MAIFDIVNTLKQLKPEYLSYSNLKNSEITLVQPPKGGLGSIAAQLGSFPNGVWGAEPPI